MRKALLLFSFLFLTTVCSIAQSESNKIVLKVSGSATSLRFSFRLTGDVTTLKVNYGEGESEQTFTGSTTSLTTASYTFTNTSETERTVEIDATDLAVLRFTSNKVLNSVTSIVAEKLETINMDYTYLLSDQSIDLSKCPALKEVTFTESGMRNITLPKGDKLETLQTTGRYGEKDTLKCINIEDAIGLKEILVQNAILDTVDLTKHTNLTSLMIYSPKVRLKAILGAKSLKKLVKLKVRGNALAFDQIPDFIENVSDLDNWDYSQQRYIRVSSDKKDGNSINVSHLLKAKGTADTEQTTTFKWRWKVASTDSYVNVPDSCISYKDGIYTFDNTSLKADEFRVSFQATNAGFAGIGQYVSSTKKCYDYIESSDIVLTHTLTGIETVSQSQGFSFSTVDGGVRLSADAPVKAEIYSLAGQKVWSGTAPATVSLPKGCYVVKPASGKSTKFVVR